LNLDSFGHEPLGAWGSRSGLSTHPVHRLFMPGRTPGVNFNGSRVQRPARCRDGTWGRMRRIRRWLADTIGPA